MRCRSSLFAPASLLALAACGGGGDGPGPSTLSGELTLPVTARVANPAPLLMAALPMVAGEVVVWLDDQDAPPDLSSRGLDLLRHGGGPIAVYGVRAASTRRLARDAATLADSAEHATALAAIDAADAPGIVDADPNYLFAHTGMAVADSRRAPMPRTSNDAYLSLMWHLGQANVPQAWDITTGSASTIVAVIDTGIRASHPDFDPNRFVPGYDMISSVASAGDGDGRDPNPNDVGDRTALQPSSFHGTHVAGTIGARTDNTAGIAGIDWNCKLMILRALGIGGSGALDDIANSILFAARLANGSGQLPSQRADVVNMSLGGPGSSSVLTNACNAAHTAGCLLVAAAGNDNTATAGTPASIPVVVSVGSVDLLRGRAPYSNFSSTIDIWAPGGNSAVDRNGDSYPDGVLSTMANDQGGFLYSFLQGTSMACPHVAGIAALVKAANPAYTNEQIRNALLATTQAGVSLPNGGRIVDAQAAVLSANGGGVSQPQLAASQTALDFGTTGTTATVDLENRGGGTLVFAGAFEAPNAGWLSVSSSPNNPPANINVNRVTFTVDRAQLQAGSNRTVVALSYDQEGTTNQFSVAVEVLAQTAPPQTPTDVVYVLAVDPDTYDTIAQAEATSANNHAWVMPGVPGGIYLIGAGTDRNDDGFINDDGELFGMWPLLDSPLLLSIPGDSSLGGLDFPLEELGASPLGNQSGGRRMLRRIDMTANSRDAATPPAGATRALAPSLPHEIGGGPR